MRESSFFLNEKTASFFRNRKPIPLGPLLRTAVMILLLPVGEELHFLFTKRSTNLTRQPGDICFPGGKQEKGESYLETALRETSEELGIPSEDIQVLGQTDYMIAPSGVAIYPFLGYLPDTPFDKIQFSKEEVAEIFSVPVSFFQKELPELHYLYLRPDPPADFPFYKIQGGKGYPFATAKIPELFYRYQEYEIWGITARLAQHASELLLQSTKLQESTL